MIQGFKNWLIKKLGGQPLKKAGITKEYWNGTCPKCSEHIGTYVRKTSLGKKLLKCGVCEHVFEKPVEAPSSG